MTRPTFRAVVSVLLLAVSWWSTPQPALAQEGGVSVARIVTAEGVENSEPVGAASAFTTDLDNVYCFVELDKPYGEMAVKILWYHQDKVRHEQPITLSVDKRARTWARARVSSKRTGDWRCDLVDGDGRTLGSSTFSIVGPEGFAKAPAADAHVAEPAEPAPSEPPADVVAVPQPAEGGATPPAEAAKESKLTLVRHVMAAGIEGQDPVGVADTFGSDLDKVYCFLQLDNMTWKEQPVTVVWYYGDKVHYRQPITVQPGPNIHTWAKANVRKSRSGPWRCEVESGSGELLGVAPFVIQE